MRLCVVSFKRCWRDEAGNWFSSGGFPLQMGAIASLFDEMTLVTVGVQHGTGGLPLPRHARVVALEEPSGRNFRRKISVLSRSGYYLSRIIRAVKEADVVHTPLPGDLPLLGMLAALAYRKRLLVRYAGSWSDNSQTTLGNRVTRALIRAASGGRNVMLATGAAAGMAARDVHWLFASSISESELTDVRPDTGRPVHSPLRLAYVGRLSPEKGVRFLIEALGLLRRDTNDVATVPRLVIIGDGPERRGLERLAERVGCKTIVRFVGQLNRGEVISSLQKSDLCVLPSLSESFGKARLDAMLCGVPVLTTEAGSGREIVGGEGERGWIVRAGDPCALATALRRISNGQEDWVRMRERCRAYAEGFTLEAWRERIGEICARRWGMKLLAGKLTR